MAEAEKLAVVWDRAADAGVDTNPVARAMLDRGYLMAPGSLFLPDQRPSTWMRFNIANCTTPKMTEALDATLQRAGRA